MVGKVKTSVCRKSAVTDQLDVIDKGVTREHDIRENHQLHNHRAGYREEDRGAGVSVCQEGQCKRDNLG